MAHHDRSRCVRWPCNPTASPWWGHHPAPAPRVDDEDDGTTSEARAEVQTPRHRREDDSA